MLCSQPYVGLCTCGSMDSWDNTSTAGADLVDWLFTHVEGFADRRDARKYACHLLKAGYIRHTVNKLTFSEQCYYVFGDYYGGICTF